MGHVVRPTKTAVARALEHLYCLKTGRVGLRSLCAKKLIHPHVFLRRFSSGVDHSRNMRFVQFTGGEDGKQRLGVINTDEVIDLSTADSCIPNNMVEFLQGDLLKTAERLVTEKKIVIPMSKVRLLAPITNPDKVLCVGLNYLDHCAEVNLPPPSEPMFFSKFPSVITGPQDDIIHPSNSKRVDWEAELVIVIGRKGKNIPESQAMDYVFGYTVAHDVTARDWQKRNGGQWLLGKTMDTFCPLGPAVVTKDEVPDPHNLRIQCRVNGETMQDSNTKQLVHKTDAIVSFVSNICTLLPGDIILTGTPPGVGYTRKPPQYLKRGDVVECEVEGLGVICNKVV